MNSSGLEETISEASGCDTWQGYEGVEHLKRRVKEDMRIKTDKLGCRYSCADNYDKSNEYIDDILKYNFNLVGQFVCLDK